MELLSDQIFTDSKLVEVKDKGIEHEDFVTRGYRVKKMPEQWSMSDMVGLLGETVRTELPIIGRMILSFTVATNVNANKRARIESRGSNATQSSREGYSRDNLTLHKDAGEWIEVLDEIRNHKKLINYGFSVMLTAEKSQIEEAEANLVALYGLNGWDIRPADNIHQILLFAILPMQTGYYWDNLEFFKFTRMAMSSEAIALVPLHVEWKGMKKSGMLLFGRRGQLFNWNPFVKIANGNYNSCVFGPSGSGKSVLLQELVVSMLAQKHRVFILDIGQSFANICHLQGGDMIKFTKDATISLNPFSSLAKTSTKDELKDAITYSKAIIGTMCGAGDNKLYDSLIQQAISDSLEKYTDILQIVYSHINIRC